MTNLINTKEINKSIKYIKGVGEARAKLFSKLNIFTVRDLIEYYPRQYEDRSIHKPIDQLVDGESCGINAMIISKVSVNRVRKGLTVCKLLAKDTSGVIAVTWYNQEYIKSVFEIGQEYNFFGKILKRGQIFEMQNPVYEHIKGNNMESRVLGKIIPVYNTTAKLTQNIIRTTVESALSMYASGMPATELQEEVFDPLPKSIRIKFNLIDLNKAIKSIHFPENEEALNQSRKRLIFEELFMLQVGLLNIKRNLTEDKTGVKFGQTEDINVFKESLPFKLTNAQEKTFLEIKRDMESSKVMNRLVQGDVGSGKTIVAAMSLYKAVKNGYQGALMVPTEILAEQHFQSIRPLFEGFGIKTALITGSTKASIKNKVIQELSNGEIDIVIGTHALIEDKIEFSKLGLVVTDEQHRFGVRQRAVLAGKGQNPDVLVMTATPIPRTLALILYGDLDISIIDELPPGRKAIKTYAVDNNMRPRINKFIRDRVSEGRQVYIVCPLVEESENIEASSAKELSEKIASEDFRDLRVGLIHGKLKPKEKDAIMHSFVSGEIDILVSTTVIEVGVNVPNATVMVIENAERFGLAQLHQLRGRVGRGSEQSYCILYNNGKGKISRERMKIMEKTCDGFIVSEKDLELRGPGEFFGVRQHGIPEFKIANIYRDMEVLKVAQTEAIELLKNDPELQNQDNLLLKECIRVNFINLSNELSFT